MNLIIILYLVGFIRTILFIVAVYFVIKLFTRFVLPLILENKIRQMQEKMDEQNHRQNHANKREGDVTIDYDNSQSASKYNPGQGEYVDFEEID